MGIAKILIFIQLLLPSLLFAQSKNDLMSTRYRLVKIASRSPYFKPEMDTKKYKKFLKKKLKRKKRRKKIKKSTLKSFFYLGKIDSHLALKNAGSSYITEGINVLNFVIYNNYRKKDAKRLKSYLVNYKKKGKGKGPKFYLELGYGQISYNSPEEGSFLPFLKNNVQPAGNSINTVTSDSVESSATGFYLGGGYLINPKWLALEFLYASSGEEEINVNFEHSGGTITGYYQAVRKFSHIELSLKFFKKFFKKFQAYATAGTNYWQVSFEEVRNVEETTTAGADENGVAFQVGGGLEYFFTKQIYTGLGVTYYPSFGTDVVGDFTNLRIALKLGYSFNI